MPQEAIERVNQLRTADRQPKLLTSCDRKGLLIGETENPGVPDIVDTTVPDEDDGTEDLNPPAVNNEHGLGKLRNINPPIIETVGEDEDPVEEPEIPEDDFQFQDRNKKVEPDPGVPDPGATKPSLLATRSSQTSVTCSFSHRHQDS